MKFTRLNVRKYVDDKLLERRLVYTLYKLHKDDESEIVYKRINGDLKALRVFDTDVVRKALKVRHTKYSKHILDILERIENDR